jgi:hypothetical protein
MTRTSPKLVEKEFGMFGREDTEAGKPRVDVNELFAALVPFEGL